MMMCPVSDPTPFYGNIVYMVEPYNWKCTWNIRWYICQSVCTNSLIYFINIGLNSVFHPPPQLPSGHFSERSAFHLRKTKAKIYCPSLNSPTWRITLWKPKTDSDFFAIYWKNSNEYIVIHKMQGRGLVTSSPRFRHFVGHHRCSSWRPAAKARFRATLAVYRLLLNNATSKKWKL